MKESHSEGLAPRTGPESCVDGRKAIGEALTGENTGQPSSGEIKLSGMPTLLSEAEGNIGVGVTRELTLNPAPSENLSTCGNSMPGNREIPLVPPTCMGGGRPGKAQSHTLGVHVGGKSDGCIVPRKPPNKGVENPSAEVAEGRRPPKGNANQTAKLRTQSRKSLSPGLERVRKVARSDKGVRFTSLMHHITTDALRESFFALKRQAAPGVDGVTWAQYQGRLEERLGELYAKVQSGTYRAQPSRRIYIPKPDGRKRPIGIAALEDKIVQHAVGEVLSAIYEQDFLGFSYGFRQGRNQHDALDALAIGLTRKRVNWVIDADIQGFFDTINHDWIVRFIEHRVADPRIVRLVRKWLRAGVSEEGTWSKSEVGTPQGAVISPLLANIYLHHALDQWIHAWRKGCALGDVIIIRFADDFVIGVQNRKDADRLLADLRARLEKFGLNLHPEKTRLIEFGRFAAKNRRRWGEGKPETFDFLGFTHICSVTRIRKRFHVWRKTVKKRLRTTIAKIKEILRSRMNDPIVEVGKWLQKAVQGYFQYHGIPGNWEALQAFHREVTRNWLKILRRRGQKKRMNWATFSLIAKRWIPNPSLHHPHPNQRFYAKHPREEPGAVIPLAGIRAGGAG